jgi:hypothetical protein
VSLGTIARVRTTCPTTQCNIPKDPEDFIFCHSVQPHHITSLMRANDIAFSEILLSWKRSFIHYVDDVVVEGMVHRFQPSTVLFKATSKLCTIYHILKAVKHGCVSVIT